MYWFELFSQVSDVAHGPLVQSENIFFKFIYPHLWRMFFLCHLQQSGFNLLLYPRKSFLCYVRCPFGWCKFTWCVSGITYASCLIIKNTLTCMCNRFMCWFAYIHCSDKGITCTIHALIIHHFLLLNTSSIMWFFLRSLCNAATSSNSLPMLMLICCGSMVEMAVLSASSSDQLDPLQFLFFLFGLLQWPISSSPSTEYIFFGWRNFLPFRVFLLNHFPSFCLFSITPFRDSMSSNKTDFSIAVKFRDLLGLDIISLRSQNIRSGNPGLVL